MINETNPAAIPQPDPVSGDGTSMHDLVIEDMSARKQFGLDEYGTILEAHNGRDPLVDGYQEILDLAVYARQAIVERNALMRDIRRMFELVPPSVIIDVLDRNAIDARGQSDIDELRDILPHLIKFAGQ